MSVLLLRVDAVADGDSATLHAGALYSVTVSMNQGYEAHLKGCEECRQTIVTNLLEFAHKVEAMR